MRTSLMSSQKTVTFSPRARSPQSGELWGRDVGLSTIEKSVMPLEVTFWDWKRNICKNETIQKQQVK